MHASTTSEYHGLLKEGYSKIESARNTVSRDNDLRGEKNKPYNEWTKEELYQEAIKAGIPGRSYMNKKSLIKSLLKN
jgi:hypothetical protein